MPSEKRRVMGRIVVGGSDEYTLHPGEWWPIIIWLAKGVLDDLHGEVGYIRPSEVVLARDDRIPQVNLHPKVTAHLAGTHIELRKAVGRLIRRPGPRQVIHIEKVPR